MLGLYVHIPFCASICNYCNFNRGLLDVPLKKRYVDALLLEIARAAEGDRGADRKSTRLNSSHIQKSRMPSSA